MASLIDLMTIARNPTFQDRVKYSMQKAAILVMAEAATVSSHALRVIYAKTVLAGTANVLEYTIAVLTNATLAAEANVTTPTFGVPDSDFDFTVQSMFNAMAGVAL